MHGKKRELAVADVFGLLHKFKNYEWLHVIDLDAAMGKGDNSQLVGELCQSAKKKFGMRVRVGGGIRNSARAAQLVRLGAEQVIVGSGGFQEWKGELAISSEAHSGGWAKRSRDCVGYTAKGNITVDGWRKRLAVSSRTRHGPTGAVLRDVFVHRRGPGRHDGRRESGCGSRNCGRRPRIRLLPRGYPVAA